jgi:hypothetical protein
MLEAPIIHLKNRILVQDSDFAKRREPKDIFDMGSK